MLQPRVPQRHSAPGADCCHRKGTCGESARWQCAERLGLIVQNRRFLVLAETRFAESSIRRNTRAAGRFLPVKLYQARCRPADVSLQFIRWLWVGLIRPNCYRPAIEQLRSLMQAYL